MISATVTPGKSKVPVQIVNDLDQFVVLKAGHSVGIATEIHEIIETEAERGDSEDSSTTDCSQSEEDSLSNPTEDCSFPGEDSLLLYFKRLIVANQLRIHCLLYFRSLIVANQLTFYQLLVLTNLIVVNQILVH